MRSLAPAVVVIAMTLGLATPALAQPRDIGTRVSGVVGGSFGTGGATFATGGSAGFQFTKFAGFEFEMSIAPDLELRNGGCNTNVTRCSPPLPSLPPPFALSEGGRAVNFVANYVAEFPTPARWLRPYVLGGGGVSSVRRQLDMTLATPVIFTSEGVSDIATLSALLAVPRTFRSTSTETDLALSSGGGVDFLVGRHFAVGADVRYMHLFGNADLDLTRIGTRLSVRF
jgi:hypothetical protein